MESIRRVRRMAGVSLVTGIASVLACDTPSAPKSLPPPPTEAADYRVSGVITFDDGRPAANASVGLAFDPGANAAHRTITGSDGTYEFRLSQLNSPPSVISVYVHEEGYTIRPLDWAGQNTIVKDLHLRRPPPALRAGDSITIAIEPDSPLCNWEFGSSMTTLCEWFSVASATVGTLTVDARPIDAGGILPLLGWDNRGVGATLSLQVQSNTIGGRYGLNLAIPVAAAPQRYVVSTSLQIADR
jgi:hypothetical protein